MKIKEKMYTRKCEMLHKKALSCNTEASLKKYAKMSELHSDSAKMMILLMMKYIDSYVGEFNGWSMFHTYRGNNSYGAKTIDKSIFYFDKDLTQVIDQKKDKEE